jgi:hypothetical protein
MARRFNIWLGFILVILAQGVSCVGAQMAQKSATYIAVSEGVTSRLRITVTRGSRDLVGELNISRKQSDGTVKVQRIPITGTVATDGVPASITIPSEVMGVPDLTLGCFFDQSLNLELSGDNRRPYPHIMYLVK